MSTQDEEKSYRLNAVYLLAPRDEEGRVKSDQPLDAVKAATLLGKVDSAYMGQGSFNLLIPKSAIREAGLDENVWRKAAEKGAVRELEWKGSSHYEVDYTFAVMGVLPILEVWSGKRWNEARELAEKYQSTGGHARG